MPVGGVTTQKPRILARKLRAEYDFALRTYDALLMPTTPLKAPSLPDAAAPRTIRLQRAVENMGNYLPFRSYGHPALSIPCAVSAGLPVGMMLVGKQLDEMTI